MLSGACLSPDLHPLFLTTVITVSSAGAGAAPSGGGGGTVASPPSAGGGGGSPSARGAAPSLAGLAGPGVPADAASLFGDTAAANGITADGVTGEGTAGVDDGVATAQRSGSSTPASAGDGPGLLATIARVTLGLAALGGVPVALAISRRPHRTVRRGFAA